MCPLIGSEGTLGFVSQATYNTVPEWPHKVRGVLGCDAALRVCPRGCMGSIFV